MDSMMDHVMRCQSLRCHPEFQGTIRLQRMKKMRHSNQSLRTKGDSQVHVIHPDILQKILITAKYLMQQGH